MLFNSLLFVIFFAVVTITYYNIRVQFRWVLLLFASCYFYMVFVPKYILILGATIVVDYFAGILIERNLGLWRSKIYLIASLIINIGALAVFKYFNFINENITSLLGFGGIQNSIPYLSILLPIGLSFHTFQAMSYTIEVYRGNQKAERHFGIYSLYVMFYPQLVAGPIERPQNLLWQFHTHFKYDFENIKEGITRMLWGLFKKVVIADRIAIAVDYSYNHLNQQNSISMIITIVLYSFQIYCDFSGYSDVALGAAKTMGFTLMDNFKTPYLSKSISEFWKRWHISLSTWFKDYLYISLGGNRVSKSRVYFNLLFVFLISGLWHGASWNFIIWGGLHGIFLVSAIIFNHYVGNHKLFSFKKNISKITNIFFTFTLVTLAWIFFRAPTFNSALLVFKNIFDFNISQPLNLELNNTELVFCSFLIIFMLIKEKYFSSSYTKSTLSFFVSFALYCLSIYTFGVFRLNQFIYFQF